MTNQKTILDTEASEPTVHEILLDRIRKQHKLKGDAALSLQHVAADLETDSSDEDIFTARISTESLDRDNEVLLPSGMKIDDFIKTGQVFFNHDYDQLPLAKAGIPEAHGSEVMCKARWYTKPEGHPPGVEWKPDTVRSLIKQAKAMGGAMGVSVGFIPIESRLPTKRDREIWGDSLKKVISKWKILEWSIAPVQSNPDAMITDVGKCVLSPAEVKSHFVVKAYSLPPEQIISQAKKPANIVIEMEYIPPKPKPRKFVVPDPQPMIDVFVAKALGKLYA